MGNTVSHSLLVHLLSRKQFGNGRPNWAVGQIKHHLRIHSNSWILMNTIASVSWGFPGIGIWLTDSENASYIWQVHGSLKHQTSLIITSIKYHLFYQRIMESCVLSSQALRPPGMMSTKPIEAASQAVLSHAGGTPVTRYQSLEINYRTAPNNERTALPILQKIISVPLCLLGRAEYANEALS